MTRDLHTAKLQRGFDFFDLDHSNGIDENDFAVMAQRVARSQGHAEGSPAAQRIRECYLALWTDGLAVVAPPGTAALGRDEFVSAIRTMVEHDLPRAQAVLTDVAEAFLETADLNADGRVDREEFRVYQHAHFPDLSDDDVDAAFAHLDTDGDGFLSGTEFVRNTIDFWCSSDPAAPGNWWLGPLPQDAGGETS